MFYQSESIRMCRLATGSLFVLLLATLFLFSSPLRADDQSEPIDDAIHDRSSELDKGIPFEPIDQRDKKTEMKVEALAYFMAGRVKKSRNDFHGALDNFIKAADIDPNSLDIYSELVPLAFALNKIDLAVKYALKAIELDPNNYKLMQKLGLHMIRKQKYTDAITLFEKALKSDQLEKNSASYIILHRDLAVLYAATGSVNKSADSYEIVFNVLQGEGKNKLDFHTKAQLLSDPRTTYERMGQVFLAAKRTDLAVQAFELASKSAKGKPGDHSFNLANVYYQTEQYDKALTELQSYLDRKLNSKGRGVYELLAEVLVKMKRENELVPKLEKAYKEDPSNSNLAYFLADQYIKAERLEDAKAMIEKSLADTGTSEGYISMASIYQKQKNAWGVLDSMTKALKGKKQLDRLQEVMDSVTEDKELVNSILAEAGEKLSSDKPGLDFEHSLLLAKLAVAVENTEDVKKYYRYCLNVNRKSALTVFNELGQYLMDVDLYGEAETVFQEAINDPVLSGGKSHFLFQLSQALEMQGKTEQALAAIGEAKSLNPDSPLYQFQESWIYIHSKQWDQAISALNAVMAAFPEEKSIIRRCKLSLSNVYVQKGDMTKGEQILEEVLKTEPEDPGVNNDLGYLYADQGKNLERAKKMIQIAVDSEPDNPAYLDSMGWVLYKLGEYEQGVVHLKKATETPGGGDSTIFDHLGDCLIKLEKKPEAVQAWQSALEHEKKQPNPDQEKIRQIQQKIDSNK